MGQNMSFQVRNTSGKQVSITPLYENLDKNPAAAKALDAAGLPHTAENLEMVNAMMKNGMSIDTKSLLDMARTVSHINSGSPASVVQMTKLGIPVNEENVQQFEAYKDNQYQIADSVDTVASDLARMAASPEEGAKIIQAFAGDIPENIKQVLSEEMAKEAAGPEAVLNGAPEEEALLTQNLDGEAGALQSAGNEGKAEAAAQGSGSAHAAEPALSKEALSFFFV